MKTQTERPPSAPGAALPAARADTPRWYHEPFVWLLIALPATSVIAGFVMLGLAISSDDGLVEDDYYRQGKEINRVLARDQAAVRRGLEGTLELNAAPRALSLRLHARNETGFPEAIEMRFLHATRAGLDKSLLVPRHADGAYRAPLPTLEPGHWHVQLAAQDWRLVGSLQIPGAARLALRPAGR